MWSLNLSIFLDVRGDPLAEAYLQSTPRLCFSNTPFLQGGINSAEALAHKPILLQTAEPCEHGTMMTLAWIDTCLGCFCTVLHSWGFKGLEKNHKRKVAL